MIVLDTSGLLAALDSSQRQHTAARRVIRSEEGPLLLSPFVLAELDYLVSTRIGTEPALFLLDEVARGAYRLEAFEAEDARQAAMLIRQHRDLGIGLAGASIVVIAGRAGTDRILTLDERHFRPIKPLRGGPFRLLPAD